MSHSNSCSSTSTSVERIYFTPPATTVLFLPIYLLLPMQIRIVSIIVVVFVVVVKKGREVVVQYTNTSICD